VGVTSPSPSPPRSPPSPIYTPPVNDGRIVPPGWLEQAPVTVGLIGLNVCAFLAEVVVTHGLSDLPPNDSLALGASYSLATLHEGRYETLVTACFLHGGIIHLLFNMVALWQAGPLVERAVGSARMAPMYLVAGVFGNVLSAACAWVMHAESMTVGASGAILGVIGAALVVYWRIGGWRNPLTQAMAKWLGLVVAFGVVMNASGGRIDNAAHVGGALSGAAIAALWKRGVHYSPAATRGILGACAAVVGVCAAVVAFHDRRDPFAEMLLHDRIGFTVDALTTGRCPDAQAGLLAVERLGAKLAAGNALRRDVEAQCGPTPAR
jgi:rhomboid protease GluP